MFRTDALAGKAALVTGGGTGIGAGISRALAEAGAKVAIAYNSNAAGAERLAAALRPRGEVLVVGADLRDPDQVARMVDETTAAFGRLDILVNNSGITEPHPLLEMTVEAWDKTLAINLRGMFLCTQHAARAMIAGGAGGSIVNLGSVHGFAASPNHAHYEASKGGINMLTKSCAIELAAHGIRVNCIAPGAIEVERYETMPDYDPEAWGRSIPLGRVGVPADIGPLAVFLAGDGASYITGQIVWVDGGMISALGGFRR